MTRESAQLAIQKLLAITSSRPAVDHAVKALLWRISSHPHQRSDDFVYMELSIGYLTKLSSVSFGSSNTAWHTTHNHIRWKSIHKSAVESYGFKVRSLKRGQKWGQHLLIDPVTYDAIREFAEWMVASDIWYPPGTINAYSSEWRTLDVMEVGNHLMARCAWHDDTNPSMIINVNKDDHNTGYGVCMACKTESGRNMSVFIRRLNGNSWEGRPSMTCSQSNTNIVRSSKRKALDGIHNPSGSGSPGRVVLARLNSRGLIGSYGKNDVLSALKWADRSGDAAEKRAWTAAADFEMSPSGMPTEFLPDRLISVSEMVACEWSSMTCSNGEFYIPKRFRPTRQRWVLIDLDDFIQLRICMNKKNIHASIDNIVHRESSLSGRFAIVRTSHTGVQIWLQLNEPRNPSEYFDNYKTKSMLADIGREISANLRSYGCTGGHVDHSAFAPGRFGRRPGWRLLSDGSPFRSSLISYSDESK